MNPARTVLPTPTTRSMGNVRTNGMQSLNMTRVAVRPATTADLPRLGRLGALLVEVHQAFDAKRFLPTRDRMPADYAAFLLRQMEDPSVALLVADDQGDVVGYAYAAVEGYDYAGCADPLECCTTSSSIPNAAGAASEFNCSRPCWRA